MTKTFLGLLIVFLFYSSYAAFIHFWDAFAANDFDGMVWESFLFIVWIGGACAVYAAWRELRRTRRRAES